MDITSNDSRTPPGGNGVAPKLCKFQIKMLMNVATAFKIM